MASPVLGIDLGTTNSVVAAVQAGAVRVLADEAGNRLFPSVVSFHPNGDVLTGYPARERRLLDAQNTIYSVKRLIGRPFRSEEVRRAMERSPFGFEEGPTGGALVVARGETYTLPELSAFVLREVRALAEDAVDAACRRAVVTVPANFNELQRSATKAAGRVAGLDVLRILNEPTAAALAYGCGEGRTRERVGVYDLGGGTFDITILELAEDVVEVLATAGDTFLGGDDIDVIVADEMAAEFLQQHRYDLRSDGQACERLRAAAEWAKCQLSSAPDVELCVEELAYGTGGEPLNLTFSMTRARLEALSQPLIARTFDVCEEAMRLSKVRPTQLDTIILVGGGTRIPMVRQMVEEYFGQAAQSSIDPDLVVAQGAAIQGAALAGIDPGKEEARSPIGRVALKRHTFSADVVPAGPAFQPKRPPVPPPPSRQGDYAGPGSPPGPAGAPKGTPETSKAAIVLDELDLQPLMSDGPGSAADSPQQPMDPPSLDDEPSFVLDFDRPSLALSPLEHLVGGEPIRPSVELPGLVDSEADMLAIPAAGAPLLLDVTPHSLAMETVAGFCEVIVPQNAAIPVEQERMFSTSQDFQETVCVRICQGESRRLEENHVLGQLELTGLRQAARGQLQIRVTFVLDSDGTLQVHAVDEATGATQAIRVQLVGGVDEAEIEAMRERQAALMEVNS